MRSIIAFLFIIVLSQNLHAKEWRSLKAYQTEAHSKTLSPSDWLKHDRIHNSIVWQQANLYNLSHNLPQEYLKISERRDFYKWIYGTLKQKGHEVVWVQMAHFISKKMHLLESFPCLLFSNRKIVQYADAGSEVVFNKAFKDLKDLLDSETILKGNKAKEWDESMAYKEQYIWLDSLYLTIDEDSLKTIERMAKGKFLYSLAVPKAIRFKGDISTPEARHSYAIGILWYYCKDKYKE